MENAGKKYLCKRIKSREDFDEFKPYLEGWCVIDDADAFENYTLGGSNKMFLFYSDNFKEIERIQGATFPRDRYGLSVICVIVDADGAICVVASRWNSDGEQERFLSDAELKQVIGQNNFGRLK